MRNPWDPDDRTAEQLLSGRKPAEDGLEPLADALDRLRSAAAGPAPDPNAALASVLADGLPSPHAPAAGAASTPRSQKPMNNLLARLVSRVALAMTGVVALATGAGAAGMLPQHANETVQTAITAVTGLEFRQASDTGEAQSAFGQAVARDAKDTSESTVKHSDRVHELQREHGRGRWNPNGRDDRGPGTAGDEAQDAQERASTTGAEKSAKGRATADEAKAAKGSQGSTASANGRAKAAEAQTRAPSQRPERPATTSDDDTDDATGERDEPQGSRATGEERRSSKASDQTRTKGARRP